MKEYLMTLISVSLLSGIMGMISPEGDLKKYVRLLCTLCVFCAMISPAFSLWQGMGSSGEEILGELIDKEDVNYDEIYKDSLLSFGEVQAEETIKSNILERFLLSEDSIDVEVKSQSENDIEEWIAVTVLLRDEAIFTDPREILSLVESMVSCSCVIVYE